MKQSERFAVLAQSDRYTQTVLCEQFVYAKGLTFCRIWFNQERNPTGANPECFDQTPHGDGRTLVLEDF